MIEDYLFPRTIDEAMLILTQNAGKAKIIGGGTAMLLDGRELAYDPKYYVDLGNIKELDGIYEEDGFIIMGANTTLTQCSQHPLIKKNFPGLTIASGNLGSTQIRNVATVVGNIMNCKPFSDLSTILIALGAVLVVKSEQGTREIDVQEVYYKLGQPSVKSTSEFITHIKIPAKLTGECDDYQRLELRKGLSFPVIGVAVKMLLKNNIIEKISIVGSPLAPGPKRIPEAEEYLIGLQPSEEHFNKAGLIASQNVRFHNSPLGCGAKYGEDCAFENCHYCLNPVSSNDEYRRQVLPVLVRRALTAASNQLTES